MNPSRILREVSGRGSTLSGAFSRGEPNALAWIPGKASPASLDLVLQERP